MDDEPSVRDLTVEILRRSGYRPRGVASARHALEVLERGAFDLVVSDVVMPGMTGVELLRELRAREHDIPVVLMTGGSAQPERATTAVETDGAGLLRKPFSQAQLRDAVEAGLRRRSPPGS